jgi:hypothetical protein
MRTQRAIVVAAVLALVGAAPASAVTGGFGVAKALQRAPAPLFVPADPVSKGRKDSCEASSTRAAKTQSEKTAKGLDRTFAPVACEQPPRSQVLTPETLKQAAHAAFAALR